jgi:hypothetical protein
MTNSEPAIARTRGCSALLNVIDDRLGIWLREESQPMGVIPSSLLTICRDGEMRLGLDIDQRLCSPARRSVPVKVVFDPEYESRWGGREEEDNLFSSL